MKTKEIKLGCIIVKNGIYIDTWHDIESLDEFQEGYIIVHNKKIFLFRRDEGYRVNEFWDTPELFIRHQQQQHVIDSLIDKTYEEITKELKKLDEN